MRQCHCAHLRQRQTDRPFGALSCGVTNSWRQCQGWRGPRPCQGTNRCLLPLKAAFVVTPLSSHNMCFYQTHPGNIPRKYAKSAFHSHVLNVFICHVDLSTFIYWGVHAVNVLIGWERGKERMGLDFWWCHSQKKYTNMFYFKHYNFSAQALININHVFYALHYVCVSKCIHTLLGSYDDIIIQIEEYWTFKVCLTWESLVAPELFNCFLKKSSMCFSCIFCISDNSYTTITKDTNIHKVNSQTKCRMYLNLMAIIHLLFLFCKTCIFL